METNTTKIEKIEYFLSGPICLLAAIALAFFVLVDFQRGDDLIAFVILFVYFSAAYDLEYLLCWFWFTGMIAGVVFCVMYFG